MSEIFDKIGGAIGFAGDVIGLAGTFADILFPGPSSADLNNFRVHVGQVAKNDTQGNDRSTGGNAPALAGWDVVGNFMSQITPDGPTAQTIDIGGFRDYAIEGRQAIDYLSVVQNGNDGICIHLITGESTNNGRKFAWNGDLGKACSAQWYPQKNPVANVGASGREFRPACVWIDGNGDSGHNFKGFNFHLGSFGGDQDEEANKVTADAWAENKDLLCKSEPRFSLYEDIKIGMQTAVFVRSPTEEIPGTSEYDNLVLNRDNWALSEPPPPGEIPQRTTGKSLVPSFICFDDNCPLTGGSFDMDLEIQEFTRWNVRRRPNNQRELDRRDYMMAALKKRAVELCNSISSLGPDLVSVPEGMFCDMSEKRLWPVCADSSSTYCFDMVSQMVRGSSATAEVPDPFNAANRTNSTVATKFSAAIEVDDDTTAIPEVPLKSYSDVSTWEP